MSDLTASSFSRSGPLSRLLKPATWAFVALMVVAAFFHNEYRAQNWDPQQTRVYVERTLRFGGTFYENGLLNKGPLEPLIYRVAAAITSWDGFWFAISAFVIVAAAIVARAAQQTVRSLGGHRILGTAVGIGVFFHFSLGKADYAGVLYSRNMVIVVLAGAWLVALNPQRWLPVRSRWSAILTGVLLGLAMQTLVVCAIAAGAVALLALDSIGSSIDDALTKRKRKRTVVGTAAFVTIAAPLYYALRGRFTCILLAEYSAAFFSFSAVISIFYKGSKIRILGVKTAFSGVSDATIFDKFSNEKRW